VSNFLTQLTACSEYEKDRDAGGGGHGDYGCNELILRHFSQRHWKRGYFYNNFEILKLEDFRPGSLYYRWFLHVDREGGIFRNRWGDAPVRTLGVLLTLGPNKILDLRGRIDYFHPPLITCASKPEMAILPSPDSKGRRGGGVEGQATGGEGGFAFFLNTGIACCVQDVLNACPEFVECTNSARPTAKMCSQCDLVAHTHYHPSAPRGLQVLRCRVSNPISSDASDLRYARRRRSLLPLYWVSFASILGLCCLCTRSLFLVYK